MRETKYNQNPQPRKAPIDREVLWSKINSDPTYPAVDNSPNKKFWLFGSIGLLLLAGVIFVCWPHTQENQNANTIGINPILYQKPELKNESQLNINLPTETSAEANTKDIDNQSQIEVVLDSTTEKQIATLKSVERKKKNTSIVVNSDQTQSQTTDEAMQSSDVQQVQSYQPQNIIETFNANNSSKVETTVRDNAIEQTVSQTSQNLNSETLQYQQDLISPFDKLTANNLLAHTNDLTIAEDNLIDIKSRKGLLAYANVSYGLSMHSITTNESVSISDDKLNIEEYLQNNESRAIEIGIKKQVLKRYRLGLGAELRQDWQKYRRFVTDTTFVFREEYNGLVGTETDYTLHQKYQSANLLLTVDRIIPLKNVLLELGGGLSYMLSMTTSGRVLDIDNMLIERSDTFPVKTSGTLGGFAQAGITYPLSENWRLSLNMRYNIPTQLSANTDLYEHKLSALRVGASVSYEF